MDTSADATLLVVEDEPNIRELLATSLRFAGFEVHTAAQGSTALQLAAEVEPDLLVLDVMLPRMDGWQVLEALRASPDTEQIPVLFLTARDEVEDRVRGLELGADDYLVKPFAFVELVARIRTVLRRAQALPRPREPAVEGGGVLRFDRWRLDLARRELLAEAGVAAPLSSGEFRLLAALLERPGLVLTRDQLLDLTRGRAAGLFDRSIDNQVSRLRRRIERDPARPALIKTVRGDGYSFVGPVARA